MSISLPIMGQPNWSMLAPCFVARSTSSATALQVYDGPCIYYGSIISGVPVGSTGLTIMDKSGANNNGNVDTFATTDIIGKMHNLGNGVQCTFGLHIPADALRMAALIYYRPIPVLFPNPY